MTINHTSFGKTVKVYAPFHEARRIANAANGNPQLKPEVQQEINKIFDDTDKGHALAFYFNESGKMGYIFSGKESREYTKSLYKKALQVRDIKSSSKTLKQKLNEILTVRYNHNNRILDIISRTKENFTLRIGKNGEKVERIPNLN